MKKKKKKEIVSEIRWEIPVEFIHLTFFLFFFYFFRFFFFFDVLAVANHILKI